MGVVTKRPEYLFSHTLTVPVFVSSLIHRIWTLLFLPYYRLRLCYPLNTILVLRSPPPHLPSGSSQPSVHPPPPLALKLTLSSSSSSLSPRLSTSPLPSLSLSRFWKLFSLVPLVSLSFVIANFIL